MASAAGRPGEAARGRSVAHVAVIPAPTTVAAFPFIDENPYQELLYHELEPGIRVVRDANFKLRDLVRSRHEVQILHFHWPQNYYSWWRRPAPLRPLLSWPKLALFAIRLVVARRLGYAVVWTIHEVFPHERVGGGVDVVGGMLLARGSHLLVAHDRGTAERAAAGLRASTAKIEIVPHASYMGVYPAGRSREEVRRELAIAEGAFVFLCFGHIRAYKDIDLLLRAFSSLTRQDVALVVAGLPLDEEAADSIRDAAARDPRIRPMLDFVPEARVAELFGASDAAVVARGDGGTSGSLVLALSMGLPVVAAALPDYAELTGGDEAGWLFEPREEASLVAALDAASADAQAAQRKGVAALDHARRFGWDEAGRQTAAALDRAAQRARPHRTKARSG
jgi:glycosyltransferase involved in cell wall biosynthesis